MLVLRRSKASLDIEEAVLKEEILSVLQQPRAVGETYTPCLVAEMYLVRDLAAIAAKDAHFHDSACGYRRARDRTLCRLLLRPACRLDTFNLEEANKSGSAVRARG